MTTSLRNFVIKNGATIGNVIIDAGSNTIFANTGTVQTANIKVTSSANLGNVGNVYIGGGNAGQVLQTDGLGNLSWSSSANINEITNGTSNVIIPSTNGNVYINANSDQWVFDTNGNLTAPSSGTANLGNLVIANYANFSSNLIAGNSNLGNLATANYVNVSSNLSASNANITSLLTTANANVTSQLNAGNANVTGNLTVANANVTTQLIANAANITNDVTVGGNANVTGNISSNNANITTLLTTGNANVTSQLNAGNANVTGNLTSNNSNITNLLTTGDANVTGNLTANNSNITNLLTTSNANVTTLLTSANANITLITAGNIFANSGTIAGNLLTGTLTTASQPNITSVGTLSLLSVSGNITTNSDLLANTVSSVSGPITVTTTTNGDINLHPNGSGNVDIGNTYITNLKDPYNPQDAATKNYVDVTAQGLSPKTSSDYATTTALPAYTYNNGTSGVGATITASANGALTIDGGSPSAGMRVLIKNETGGNQPYNGIYVVTDAGSAGSKFILTRSSDFDLSSPSSEIPGAFTFVIYGTSNANTGWICTTLAPVTVGTTNITFTQFSAAGEYTAGTGISVNGTVISIANTSVSAGSYGGGDQVATFTVNDQGQLTNASNTYITANAANLTGTYLSSTIVNSNLTSVGTLSSLEVFGNITSDTGTILAGTIGNSYTVLVGDGGQIGNINGSNVTGNVANANLAGYVTQNAQSNITSVGTLTSLEVTGDITSDTGNITAGIIGSNATYLIGDGSNVTNVTAVSMDAGNLTGSTLSSNVTNSSLTSVGTLSNLTAQGTVDFTGAINVNMEGSSNIDLGSIGNIHILGGMSGQYLQTDGLGTLSWSTINTSSITNGTSNVNIASAGANVTISVDGQANVLVVTEYGANITGYANITGDVSVGGNVSANIANVTTLTVNGNANVGNLGFGSGIITGTGNISAGNVFANSGTVSASLLTGTLTTGAQPNVTSTGTLTSLSVSGNANVGNIGSGNLTATGNITGANIITGGYVSATGNVSAGQVNSGSIYSTRSDVSVTTSTVIDQFSPAIYRSAKYLISAQNDNGYESTEVLLIQDGVSSYITVYGCVSSNVSTDIVDISSDINGITGNVSLYASSTGGAGNCKVNIMAIYVQI